MSILKNYESGIKESKKLCLSYLKEYKKYEITSPSQAEYCLEKALGCFDHIEEWFEKAENFRSSFSDREFTKLVKFRNESKQECINKFAELGFDTSDL
jgi:hypothetical protein